MVSLLGLTLGSQPKSARAAPAPPPARTLASDDVAVFEVVRKEVHRRALDDEFAAYLADGERGFSTAPPTGKWSELVARYGKYYVRSPSVPIVLDVSPDTVEDVEIVDLFREGLYRTARIVGHNDLVDPERINANNRALLDLLRRRGLPTNLATAAAQANDDKVARARATVLLVDRDEMTEANGLVSLKTERLWSRFGICPPAAGQRPDLPNQPSLGRCSGVFVGSDLVLTAAHCLGEFEDVDRIRVLSGYETHGGIARVLMLASAVGTVSLAASGPQSNLPGAKDWALLRVAGTSAPEIAVPATTDPLVNAPVYSAGHPLGLPRKIVATGRVLERNADRTYEADLEIFAISSGSPVWSAESNKLVGIALGGLADFETRDDRDCQDVVHCRVGCDGERILDISRVREAIVEALD